MKYISNVKCVWVWDRAFRRYAHYMCVVFFIRIPIFAFIRYRWMFIDFWFLIYWNMHNTAASSSTMNSMKFCSHEHLLWMLEFRHLICSWKCRWAMTIELINGLIRSIKLFLPFWLKPSENVRMLSIPLRPHISIVIGTVKLISFFIK